jgi:hypothetical protein
MHHLVVSARPEHKDSATRIDGLKAADLRQEQNKVQNMDSSVGFEAAFRSLVAILDQGYCRKFPALKEQLRQIWSLFNTGSISRARSIEIELVNAGLVSWEPATAVWKHRDANTSVC